VVVLVLIALFAVICYVIVGDEKGVPTELEYRNADDLYKISNVKFPEVVAVDSSYYLSFSWDVTYVKFVLKDRSKYQDLISDITRIAKTDSLYWSETDYTYHYYILPEEPINRPQGTGWRITSDGRPDWDGHFISIDIPKVGVSDTILLEYGWGR
jgi:hypothetical protein